MKKQRFNGPMGKWIKQHIELRRSLGYIYKSAKYDLDAFDQHLAKHFPNCKMISRELITSYIECIRHLMPLSRAQCIKNLRQFCRFMFQFNQNTYIPEKGLIGPALVQVKPHIFTEAEIVKLIEQTKKLHIKHTLLPYTYQMIIGLLWVTGMRMREVVNLKLEDVDTISGIIYVRQTKFFKSRLIPLSKSSIQALIKYKNKRVEFGYSEEPGTPFFYNNRGKPCITATTPRTIRGFMIKAGLKTIHNKTPRVHDIRHTFATRCLLNFYQSGKDPTAYLPVLATYLGHANITNTQVYLHPSIELLNIASQKVQSYTQSFQGEKNETSR
jgi:integrase/recombinase XerD